MDTQNILRPNQLVHIEMLDRSGQTVRYPSRVENIEGNEIYLANPVKNRLPVHIPKGTEITIWFWDNVAIYTFRSSALGYDIQGVPMVIIRCPDSVDKVQKREYVRVQCSLNVHLSFTDKKGESFEHWCRTRDLSGGGMMLILTKPIHLKIDENVRLEFQLGNNLIWAKGAVIWNDWELDVDGLERNIIGIKFNNISDKNRQLIIKYVFQKQIELRRKGLL